MVDESVAFNTRELITIQAGPVTNGLLAHFWNLQLSALIDTNKTQGFDSGLDNEILFEVRDKHALRPRVLAVDLPGSVDPNLGARSQAPQPSSSSLDCPLWHGAVDRIIRCTPSDSASPSASSSLDELPQHASGSHSQKSPSRWSSCLSPVWRDIWSRSNSVLLLDNQMTPLRARWNNKMHHTHRNDGTAESDTFISFNQVSVCACCGDH